jgi:hypothetical protein
MADLLIRGDRRWRICLLRIGPGGLARTQLSARVKGPRREAIVIRLPARNQQFWEIEKQRARIGALQLAGRARQRPCDQGERQIAAVVARHEERSAWSASAGVAVLATGLTQAAWVLSNVRRATGAPAATLYLEWEPFEQAPGTLLVWEAFVTRKAKGTSHIEDARFGAEAFVRALPDPRQASTITTERPLSLAGAAAIWSGWLTDLRPLHTPTLVISAGSAAPEN